MRDINETEYQMRMLAFSENNPDILTRCENVVTEISSLSPLVISENCYPLLYQTVFDGITEKKLVKNYTDVIVSDILDTSLNGSDIDKTQLSVFSKEISKVLKANRVYAKTGTIPDNYEGKSSTTNQDKQRASKLKSALLLSAKYVFPASTMDSSYYYVEKTNEVKTSEKNSTIIGRGIYYSTSQAIPKMLTDCFISVQSVSTTRATSTDKRFTYTLEILNRQDETFVATLTSSELKFGKLFETLEHCNASSPPSKYLGDMLIHAIMQLAHKEEVLRQIEVETLGYHEIPNGEKVYVLTNGIETVNGFVSSEKSPFISPNIPTYANGYKGHDVCTTNDDIMRELFCNLNPNPDVQIIMLALLGASCVVSYPIGEYNGTLPFAIEIIGDNGHGKTPLLNYMLSFFGIDFNWHKATIFNDTLSDGDTPKSRAKILSKMKYTLFADTDNKQTPNHGKTFDKTYDMRNKTNASISDGAGRMYLSITREERYVQPSQGGLVRTGNYDYAIISLQRDNVPYEKRTCTFLWVNGAYNNADVSKLIDKKRKEYYAIGYSYRKWCMQKSDSQLLELFEQAKEIAETHINNYEWTNDDTYKYHTVAFLIGIQLFIEFLREVLPDTFMLEWITEHIPLLIKNRVDRTNYIFGEIRKELETDLISKVLIAIRIQFANSEMYVNSQQDKAYTSKSTDIPFCGLDSLGYHDGKIGKVKVGYVVSNGEYIAFKKDLLFNQLQKYGKLFGIDFRNMKYIENLLIQFNLVVKNDTGKIREVFYINKKTTWLLGVPLSAIYSDMEVEQEISDDSKIVQLDEKRNKPMKNITGDINKLDMLVSVIGDNEL